MADRTELLAEDAIAERLAALPRWNRRGSCLHRELSFRDFTEAFGFMTMVALVAERLNHHPDWSNSWNRVVIDITNHAAGGLTEIDFELASAIDRALGEA
ncbi:MAG TPA: 4a-hydroxytetrahydrobiopterin dehydratase [Acidimicrobiales bacterium]